MGRRRARLGRLRPRLQGLPAAQRGVRLLGQLLVRRLLRGGQLRLRLLLAGAVRAGQGDRRARRGRPPAALLHLPAGHVALRRRVAGLGLRRGDERVPGARPGPLHARPGAHRGRASRCSPAAGRCSQRCRSPSAIFANPMAFVVCGPLMVADVLGRPECRRRYLWFFVALAPFVARASRHGGGVQRARRLPQRDLAAHAVPRLRPRRAGPGGRERRTSPPPVRHPLPHLLGALRAVVRHAGEPAGQQHRTLLLRVRAPAAVPPAALAAQAPVPLRRSGDDPHRAVRRAADQRAVQPLHAHRRVAADARRVLRPGAGRGAAVLRPQLPHPRGGAAPPRGGGVLPRGRATPSRAAGTARRTPCTTGSSTPPTTPPTYTAWLRAHGRGVRLPRRRAARRVEPARGAHPPRRRRSSSSWSRPAPGPSTGCGARAAARRPGRRQRRHQPCGPPPDRLQRERGRARTGSSSRGRRTGRLEGGAGALAPADGGLHRPATWTTPDPYVLRFEVTPGRVLDTTLGKLGV